MCEHTFVVTSDGSPYTRLQRAIQSSNLPLIHATAAELGWVLLRDALAILMVIGAKDEVRFGPAAVRWAGRLALEVRDLQLSELAQHSIHSTRFPMRTPNACCWNSRPRRCVRLQSDGRRLRPADHSSRDGAGSSPKSVSSDCPGAGSRCRVSGLASRCRCSTASVASPRLGCWLADFDEVLGGPGLVEQWFLGSVEAQDEPEVAALGGDPVVVEAVGRLRSDVRRRRTRRRCSSVRRGHRTSGRRGQAGCR